MQLEGISRGAINTKRCMQRQPGIFNKFDGWYYQLGRYITIFIHHIFIYIYEINY